MEQWGDLLEHKNKPRFIFGSENESLFVFMNSKSQIESSKIIAISYNSTATIINYSVIAL